VGPGKGGQIPGGRRRVREEVLRRKIREEVIGRKCQGGGVRDEVLGMKC
jgi:hypothetical protein